MYSKPRLEGRALEHGLTSYCRAQRNGVSAKPAQYIRMIRKGGGIDLVRKPAILSEMLAVSSAVCESIQGEAPVVIRFAEQTARNDSNQQVSIDIRASIRKKEAWLETKWSRKSLKVAHSNACAKADVFQALSSTSLQLDANLGGGKVPRPHYIGALGVGPRRWRLSVTDRAGDNGEEWSGGYVVPPQSAKRAVVATATKTIGAMKVMKAVSAMRKPAKAAVAMNKYDRYGKTANGKARLQKYRSMKLVKKRSKGYQQAYAATAAGRAARAAARLRYNNKKKRERSNP